MIELTAIRYGPGYFQSPGTRLELSPDQERALVDSGRARYLPFSPETEKRQPETAAIKAPKRRGKRR